MSFFIDWLAMGGYAFYVWPAYGLAFVVLVGNIWGITRQKRLIRQQLQQWFKHSKGP